MKAARVSLHSGRLFRGVMYTLLDELDTLEFVVKDGELRIHGMSPPHTTMMQVRFQGGIIKEIEGEGKFWVDSIELSRRITTRTLLASDEVSLQFEGKQLVATFSSEDVEKVFTIELEDEPGWFSPYQERMVKDILPSLTNHVVLWPRHFKYAIEILKPFVDHTVLEVRNGRLWLKNKKTLVKLNCIAIPKSAEEDRVKLALEYMAPIMHTLRVSERLDIRFGEKVPALFQPKFQDAFEMDYVIAPIVEDTVED